MSTLLSICSCKAQEPTPAVETPTPEPQAQEIKIPAFEEEIRFLSYNVKNYLTMVRYQKGGKKTTREKPEEEKAALIEVIVSSKPHLLGLCEIGTEADLAELQTRLKAKGLDLPFSHHTGGADKTRRLAMLSAYPFSATNSQRELTYRLGGNEYPFRRGILDVTIDLPFGPTHFLGVHFKSKREIEEADQELIRLNEAMLTRKHADAILEKDPKAKIVVYGDFNDTRRQPAVKKLKGHYRAKVYLEDLMLRDSRGDLWTHYWDYQHQYSRFDYVLVSRALKPQVDFKSSFILDPKNWFKASDHRAILTVFKSETASE